MMWMSLCVVSRRHKLLSQDLRAGLCGLFAVWSGRYGLGTTDRGYITLYYVTIRVVLLPQKFLNVLKKYLFFSGPGKSLKT